MSEDMLYLVDGSGYIYRAFHAVQPLSNSKGLPTNALFGFSRMLTKLLRDVSAQYIAVAFDSAGPTFRHEKYDQYKANRAECPEELVRQMPFFRELTRAYGIKVLEKSGVEADDILATIATRCESLPVTIVSGDKDLCQLVDSRITVWDAMRDVRYDPAGVEAKFGVKPEQIIDYLALTGDSSDNVPGIQGVGPKTAVHLLTSFGSIDGIYADLNAVTSLNGLRGAARVKELLDGRRDQLRLSQWLVTLLKDVEDFTGIEPGEMHWQGPDEDKLSNILRELEFRTTLFPNTSAVKTGEAKGAKGAGKGGSSEPPNLTGPENKPGKTSQAAQPVQGSMFQQAVVSAPPIERDFIIILRENFSVLHEALEGSQEFAFDTETDSLDALSAKLVGLSFAIRNQQGEFRSFYVPCRSEVGGEERLSWEELSPLLAPFFSSKKLKVAANLKYDMAVLRTNGITCIGPYSDIMLVSYVFNPDLRQHGLKELARRYLHEEMVSYAELTKGYASLDAVPLERIASYASHDAEAALKIHHQLRPQLSPGQEKLLSEIELPLVKVLEDMERAGIKVDRSILEGMSQEFEGEIRQLEKELYALCGREINLNSPKQLSSLLFGELKLPTAGIKKTTHGYSTDAAALDRLCKVHPFPQKLLEYRELFKLKSTYLDALQRLIRPETGRIHTSFNQAIAATGRLSSSEPNLQNIPIRNDRGRKIRRAFVAEKGSLLISADYSQVELRILAHLADDKALRSAFESGADIHTRTAELIFPNEFLAASDARKKELRRYAKTINFGVIYGMGAFRLADELEISRGEASEFIKQYFANYSGVSQYFAELEESAKQRGYVETLFGRRRYLRDIDSSGRDFNYAVRSALNAPIQGTAADIMKLAMIKLHRSLERYEGRAKLVLQVHDELVVEAEVAIAQEVNQLVCEEMKGAVSLSVPLEVESRVSTGWS